MDSFPICTWGGLCDEQKKNSAWEGKEYNRLSSRPAAAVERDERHKR